MPNAVHVVGLDIAKSVFQVHCANERGGVVVNRERNLRSPPTDQEVALADHRDVSQQGGGRAQSLTGAV